MNLAALMRVLAEKGLSAQDIADVVEASQKPEAKRAKAKGRFVPEGWHPTESHHAKALELGISEDAFMASVASFREWEFKDGKSNFDLAFHRWLRTNAGRSNGTAIVNHAAERHQQNLAATQRGLEEAAGGGRRQRWRL